MCHYVKCILFFFFKTKMSFYKRNKTKQGCRDFHGTCEPAVDLLRPQHAGLTPLTGGFLSCIHIYLG